LRDVYFSPPCPRRRPPGLNQASSGFRTVVSLGRFSARQGIRSSTFFPLSDPLPDFFCSSVCKNALSPASSLFFVWVRKVSPSSHYFFRVWGGGVASGSLPVDSPIHGLDPAHQAPELHSFLIGLTDGPIHAVFPPVRFQLTHPRDPASLLPPHR